MNVHESAVASRLQLRTIITTCEHLREMCLGIPREGRFHRLDASDRQFIQARLHDIHKQLLHVEDIIRAGCSVLGE